MAIIGTAESASGPRHPTGGSPATGASATQRHVVISGTGRAGTSFLMQFLNACGLETGELNDSSTAGNWDPRSRAGWERRLRPDPTAPYVIKDPWLFAYCDQLDMSRLKIDTLIVPVRDLMSAAGSRVHQERMALTERKHERDLPDAQLAAVTRGGVIYSLDVVDQARLLAVAFYNLVEWAMRNGVPLLLLEFPRLVEDRDYLLEKLWPWLGTHCTLDAAQRAFVETAKPAAVRIRNSTSAPSDGAVLGSGEPDRGSLDRTALLERIEELEQSASDGAERASGAELALRQAQRELAETREQLGELEAELRHARQQLTAVIESRSWRWLAPLRGRKSSLRRPSQSRQPGAWPR